MYSLDFQYSQIALEDMILIFFNLLGLVRLFSNLVVTNCHWQWTQNYVKVKKKTFLYFDLLWLVRLFSYLVVTMNQTILSKTKRHFCASIYRDSYDY